VDTSDSLITIAVSKLCKVENITNRILIRFIICFCFAFLSAMLRDIWGINIPKISNTLSILVLICIGQALGSFKLRFDNKLLLLLSLVIFLQYTVLTPSVALNSNKYKDVVFLVISSVSSLYVFRFIAKKIANTNLGGNKLYRKRVLLDYGIPYGRFSCVHFLFVSFRNRI